MKQIGLGIQLFHDANNVLPVSARPNGVTSLPRVGGATLSLSMLLHELTTNALKHGALSTDAGRVSIDWSVDGDRFILEWRESGGPAVKAPARKGFGSRLIHMGLLGAGDAAMRYEPSGLHATFTAPMSQLQLP